MHWGRVWFAANCRRLELGRSEVPVLLELASIAI
jgi:hypothetical protein